MFSRLHIDVQNLTKKLLKMLKNNNANRSMRLVIINNLLLVWSIRKLIFFRLSNHDIRFHRAYKEVLVRPARWGKQTQEKRTRSTYYPSQLFLSHRYFFYLVLDWGKSEPSIVSKRITYIKQENAFLIRDTFMQQHLRLRNNCEWVVKLT